MTTTYTCPVCGYPELTEEPRLNGSASHEICFCCGFQYGYTDDDQGWTYETWRARWVTRGMPWKAISVSPPPGWDPAAQLASLLDS